MPKKLLFISATNLTVNPRILKELKYAVSQNYNVDFIGFNSGNWSDKIDEKIIKNIEANFNYISTTRKPFFKWFIGSVTERLYKKLYLLRKKNLKINAYAHSKRTLLLNNYLQKNYKKYDLIIAHTLPTLYPAYKFANRTNTKFTFDIEDYHPGEIVPTDTENEPARRIFLMKNILPEASFITYASPLIGKYSLKLLNNYPENKHNLINNCFSQTEFKFAENNSDKIKFVWFSQNISPGRGLELVIPALEKFKNKIELHLIGNLYADFNDNFLSKYSDFIKFHKPLSQKELNLKLAEFDIGLAVEISAVDLNKKIALSNKIFAYTQSGLYVLATDTPAQINFIQEHKNIGLISEQNIESFANSIEKIINNISQIRKNKKSRFNYAQKLSWEKESEKILEIWNEILK
ncbi:MAG: glycosyltransferase family 4 protein [Chlorobi bacterium]|nr:glycosyltransferase family 4 protein [Chlorobiota bacterium]